MHVRHTVGRLRLVSESTYEGPATEGYQLKPIINIVSARESRNALLSTNVSGPELACAYKETNSELTQRYPRSRASLANPTALEQQFLGCDLLPATSRRGREILPVDVRIYLH